MSITSEHFVPPSDSRWSGALGHVRHDFYHLPCYAKLAAEREGGAPYAYVDRVGKAEILIPLLVREIPGEATLLDASCPYGYPGPVASHPLSIDEVMEVAQRFRDRGREVGLVSSFVRMNPILSPTEGWDLVEGVERVDHGPTVGVDLEGPNDAWLAAVRSNHRRDIEKLLRAGYTIRYDFSGDEAAFRSIYTQTMKRVGADETYFFSDSYFDALKACLGERQLICAVLDPSGNVAAAALFVATNGVVQYHLGGTAGTHTREAPSKLYFMGAREWAREHGAEVLHLGGGLGARKDSLYRFKEGFAEEIYDFRTLRIIHNPEAFAVLCASLDTAPSDFFPPYRRPFS